VATSLKKFPEALTLENLSRFSRVQAAAAGLVKEIASVPQLSAAVTSNETFRRTLLSRVASLRELAEKFSTFMDAAISGKKEPPAECAADLRDTWSLMKMCMPEVQSFVKEVMEVIFSELASALKEQAGEGWATQRINEASCLVPCVVSYIAGVMQPRGEALRRRIASSPSSTCPPTGRNGVWRQHRHEGREGGGLGSQLW